LQPGWLGGHIGEVSGPFFVGGTGRCGTSQLCRVLGDHPEVHALQWESRFLVDPGGFSRDGQLTDPEHREVLSRLRWAAEEPGYETMP